MKLNVMKRTPRLGSNREAASISPMLPSLISSWSGYPDRAYFLATETTKRRFDSISFRNAFSSPAFARMAISRSSSASAAEILKSPLGKGEGRQVPLRRAQMSTVS
jgi:hypothetical protein